MHYSAPFFLQVSIPFVILSILGWLLFVIGFSLFNFGDL